MGWILQSTPNGRLVWHNGGTTAYGAFIGTAPDKDVGVIVLTNETNVGFPDAIGEWTLDRLLGNPDVDHAAARLKAARDSAARDAAEFVRPASPSPPPPLAPLAGDFANPAFGKATLTEDGDGLALESQRRRSAQPPPPPGTRQDTRSPPEGRQSGPRPPVRSWRFGPRLWPR